MYELLTLKFLQNDFINLKAHIDIAKNVAKSD